MTSEFRFMLQPTTIEVGVSFDDDIPVVLEMNNIPRGFSSFTAQACVKKANSDRLLPGHLGGSPFARTVFDEGNNTVYFVFKQTSILKRGTFRLAVSLRGVNPTGETEFVHLNSKPIHVVGDRLVRDDLNSQIVGYLAHINALM